MLQSAVEHYRRQQRITTAGLVAALRARGKGPVEVARVVAAFQLVAARDSADSIPLMLEEQGIDEAPAGAVAVSALSGVASDGRSLVTLFEQATTDHQFALMVATQLQDAARGAASIGITMRDQIGYVRMLNPPSCSRCVVLAGKWFKWNQGFQRHPRCDCRHIPARESGWNGLTTNPDDYFHSLPESEQNRIFTTAGAQAIRDGADLTQVVNARRGMQTAQVFGRELTFTTEGTTSRGLAFQSLSQRGGAVRRAEELATRNTRNGPELRRIHRERARAPRVMPESIYGMAKDREDAIRLLRLNGFIL